MTRIDSFEEFTLPKNLRILHCEGNKIQEFVFSKNFKPVAYIKATNKFDGTYIIEIAGRGYGMLMYKFMLMFLYPGKIIPDRYVVSDEAFKMLIKLNKEKTLIKEPITKDDNRFSRKWSHDDQKNSILNTAYSLKPTRLFNKMNSRIEEVDDKNKELLDGREFFKIQYSTRKSLD